MKYQVFRSTLLTVAASGLLCLSLPLMATEADDRIEASFKKSHVYALYLKDDAVTAKSKDGVVTLDGTVAAESHKLLAQETAASLPGVTRVENKLVTKAEAKDESKDQWTARKVRMTLLFHRNVNAGKTAVAVKDGVVTLSGEAANQAQKDLAGEYALDIDGVKAVQNDMTVALKPAPEIRTLGEQIDDASITAQVKTALLSHRSTSHVLAQVTTRDGQVALTGIAKNDAEKSLITKVISDIHGVTGVDNKMTIAAALIK